MFHPTSLVPVEAIMTMIRAIKIDHGTDPEWSLFRIHTVLDLDGPLGGIEKGDPIGAFFFGFDFWSVFLWFLPNFLHFCSCFMAFLAILPVSEAYFLEFKTGFGHGLQLVNNFGDLNDILAISWQFLAVFESAFWLFSFVFLVILWESQNNFLPNYSQFTGLFYWTNNHIQISLISP